MSVLDGVDRIAGVGGAAAWSSSALPAAVSASSRTARTPAVVALVVVVLALLLQLAIVATAANITPYFGSTATPLRALLGLDGIPPLWGTFGDERAAALVTQTGVFFALFFSLPLPVGVLAVVAARRAPAARRDQRLLVAQLLCVAMVPIAVVAGRGLAAH